MHPKYVSDTIYELEKSYFSSFDDYIADVASEFKYMSKEQKYRIGQVVSDLRHKLGIGSAGAFELYVRLHELILRHEQVKERKDLPEWFCWYCREWTRCAVEPAWCSHCGKTMRRNGAICAGWRE
jgi:hypothetical protein